MDLVESYDTIFDRTSEIQHFVISRAISGIYINVTVRGLLGRSAGWCTPAVATRAPRSPVHYGPTTDPPIV
jgi:hypothetical protein